MSATASVEAGTRGRNHAWLRALALTAPIPQQPQRVFADVVAERATINADAPALLADGERLSYGALAARACQYARWALASDVARGETVALLMPSRPEYAAVWIGISSVGGVVALVNTHLRGRSLAHALNVVAPRHVIVAPEQLEAVRAVRADLTSAPTLWTHGDADGACDIGAELARHASAPLDAGERRGVSVDDRALYIYTSGTTGLPKAANVTHFRVMQWSHWFAGMLDTAPVDRMYDCLPMYHSVGGVLAIGALLATGGSVVVRDTFSAGRFWRDVVEWDCTLFQYIGELCRYLLRAAPCAEESRHRIRVACGNGLRADVWTPFQQRFGVPRILEFYAATEGNVSFFNVEGKPGAIGRVPPFLAHRFPVTLVRFDVEREEPVRDANGHCIRCGPGEVGEALGTIPREAADGARRFEGYAGAEASARRILRDVFAPGDAWFRTGDLMRQDAAGYVYFVDRIGDTFRWKGENVATAEVAEAVAAFPGVQDATAYGVEVPGCEGRAGMAAVAAGPGLDLAALRAHLADRLPPYARPRFVRVRGTLDVTPTLKHTKADLVREGYDPGAGEDAVYLDHPELGAFVRVDKSLFARLQSGELRL